MQKTNIHPDVVLNALLDKGPRSNKVETLKKLHQICQQQYQSQSEVLRDFSVASIGKLCEVQGLFKARVLYNAASADYVQLITAWAAFSGPASVKTSKEPKVLASHEYLMRIEDPAIRMLMQATIAERDELRATVNLLKSKMQVTIDMRSSGISFTQDGKATPVLLPKAQLTDSERAALQKAVSKEFLEQEGWAEGSHGEIKKGNRTLFDVGYASAVRKILGE